MLFKSNIDESTACLVVLTKCVCRGCVYGSSALFTIESFIFISVCVLLQIQVDVWIGKRWKNNIESPKGWMSTRYIWIFITILEESKLKSTYPVMLYLSIHTNIYLLLRSRCHSMWCGSVCADALGIHMRFTLVICSIFPKKNCIHFSGVRKKNAKKPIEKTDFNVDSENPYFEYLILRLALACGVSSSEMIIIWMTTNVKTSVNSSQPKSNRRKLPGVTLPYPLDVGYFYCCGKTLKETHTRHTPPLITASQLNRT